MLKKIILALLGVVVSGFTFAGSMGPVCTPGQVTVPCETRAWDLGIQALYLRSVFDADTAYQPSMITINRFDEIKNQWDWGFRLEGSYHYFMGDDISLNWTHFKDNANQADLAGIIPLNAAAILIGEAYKLNAQTTFDQVNLVLGQHMDINPSSAMRLYSGLQYAHLQINSTNYFAFIPPAPLSSISQFNDSDFKGFGLTGGIDYLYELNHGLSFTASGAGSILVGNSRFSSGYVGAPVGIVPLAINGNKRAMVPSLEAKLGLNYTYTMQQGVLNLEGGYQALNYFNMMQTPNLVNVTNGIIAESDFALYGPYFGLKYVAIT